MKPSSGTGEPSAPVETRSHPAGQYLRSNYLPQCSSLRLREKSLSTPRINIIVDDDPAPLISLQEILLDERRMSFPPDLPFRIGRFRYGINTPLNPSYELAGVRLSGLPTPFQTLARSAVGGGRTRSTIRENLNTVAAIGEYNGTSMA